MNKKPFLRFDSISSAAKVADVERQNLHKMIVGKENPTVKMCFRFAKNWNVDILTVLKVFYPKEMEEYNEQTNKIL